MSSNYEGYGTVTTDVSTASVSCRGWATLSAHLDSGTGTWTWEFKGPDGVWRQILGGSDSITVQAFTASNMVNVFFGNDVVVRGTGSSGSTPVWDWQIASNVANRD
jgi:hypothetical protein